MDEVEFEKHFLTEEENQKREIFAIIETRGNRGNTFESEKLFEKTQKLFSPFIKAVVTNRENDYSSFDSSNTGQVMAKLTEDYTEYLVLVDENRNQLHLTGCTSGYAGTGPHGTHKILEKLGFKVDMRYLISAHQFELYLPEHYEQVYGLKV